MRFPLILQGKLVPTFRAFSHSSRTSEGSAIRYVEGKAAFWAFNHMFRLRNHSMSLSSNEPISEILKTFLKVLKWFGTKILMNLKTIKYTMQVYMESVCKERISLGKEC
jgi:hypothetical protein